MAWSINRAMKNPFQNHGSYIIEKNIKFHFPVTIFLTPAENKCYRNFPAVFSMSGGVVTGGCFEFKLLQFDSMLQGSSQKKLLNVKLLKRCGIPSNCRKNIEDQQNNLHHSIGTLKPRGVHLTRFWSGSCHRDFKIYPFLIPILRESMSYLIFHSKILQIGTVPYTKIVKIDTVLYTNILKIDTLPNGTSPYPKYVQCTPPGLKLRSSH